MSRPAQAPGYLPLGVHLVGSVPLRSAEEVFRTLSLELGTRLRRIADGETGPRADWIVWQYPVLSSRPEFEVAPPTAHSYRAMPRLKLRDDADAAELRFEELGYAVAATTSFRTFALLKRDGELPRGCRFQVSLPTPLAQRRFTVTPATDSGRPASRAAIRATFRLSSPAWLAQPR